jgi:hypothetical protein
MFLSKHERNQDGTFRKERSDSLVKNLKLEYPVLKKINGNTKLGTLKEKFKTDSLDGVLRALKKRG